MKCRAVMHSLWIHSDQIKESEINSQFFRSKIQFDVADFCAVVIVPTAARIPEPMWIQNLGYWNVICVYRYRCLVSTLNMIVEYFACRIAALCAAVKQNRICAAG